MRLIFEPNNNTYTYASHIAVSLVNLSKQLSDSFEITSSNDTTYPSISTSLYSSSSTSSSSASLPSSSSTSLINNIKNEAQSQQRQSTLPTASASASLTQSGSILYSSTVANVLSKTSSPTSSSNHVLQDAQLSDNLSISSIHQPNDHKISEIEYYSDYDPYLGVRIALSLLAIIILFAIFLTYKSHCNAKRAKRILAYQNSSRRRATSIYE